MADIPVNPEVLKWARTLRGLSLEAAARRLGIPSSELDDYERRRRRPNLSMLRKMSAKYRINEAALLMPEPIDDAEVKPLIDYRINGHGNPGFEANVAIQDIRGILETLAELKHAAPGLFGPDRLDTVEHGEDPNALAARIRAKFRVTIAEQVEQWRSDALAREHWRKEIERRGVFVYFRPLGKACSGLTIKQDGLFAICVNDQETNNGRRIFTMMHEFCHVLRRQTGISDENFSNPVERYCSRFASAILIPASALATRLGEPTIRDFSIHAVSGLASKFKVSISAMALRLESLGYAKDGLYDRVDKIVKSSVREKPANSKVRIDPVSTQARRLGARHTRITLDALKRGVINTADAQTLLGIEPAKFAALRSATE